MASNCASPGRICKDDLSQALAVDMTCGVQDLTPERLHDVAVARRTGLLEPSADAIGIHHRGPPGREHGGDRGLSDADPSR